MTKKHIFLTDAEKERSRKHIEDAVYVCGGSPFELAKLMGTSGATIRAWLNNISTISPQKALQLELIIRERKEKIAIIEISKEILRPDIFK